MNENSIVRCKENIIFRKIEDECVLLPVSSSAEEAKYIFNLNEIGGSIWEKIDGKKTVKDILRELYNKYEGDRETIKREAAEFLLDLKESGLIDEL